MKALNQRAHPSWNLIQCRVRRFFSRACENTPWKLRDTISSWQKLFFYITSHRFLLRAFIKKTKRKMKKRESVCVWVWIEIAMGKWIFISHSSRKAPGKRYKEIFTSWCRRDSQADTRCSVAGCRRRPCCPHSRLFLPLWHKKMIRKHKSQTNGKKYISVIARNYVKHVTSELPW